MRVKVIRWIDKGVNILLVALLIITATLVLTSVASGGNPKVFGQELKVVYSGSMEPEISTGSVIGINPNVNKESLSEGDIIMFQQEQDVFVTHRITDVMINDGNVMYGTKGDNNESSDMNPVLSENVYGVHGGINIPYVGYAMDFANSQFGLAALLVIPGVMLLFHSTKIFIGLLKDRKPVESHETVKSESH